MVALTSGVSLFFSRASDLQGQTKEDVRKAFRGLRNDHIRYDCSRAAYWLYKHREALRDQMLEELYATKDAQARDVLLDLLFATNRFVPDENSRVSWSAGYAKKTPVSQKAGARSRHVTSEMIRTQTPFMEEHTTSRSDL